MITKKFKELQKLTNEELLNYSQEIRSLNPNWYEYNNLITDYSIHNVAVTNRLIPPYNASDNHGSDVYDPVIKIINEIKPESIVDLGCASGELLSKIDCKNKYGLTIHAGEVRFARDKYNLSGVIPADMRDVDKYFKNINMVIAWWSFNYLTLVDKIYTLEKIHKILLPGGSFIHIDEYSNPETVLPEVDDKMFFISDRIMTKYGELTILTKHV